MRYSEGLREPRIHEYPTKVHAEGGAEDAGEGEISGSHERLEGSRGDAAVSAAVAARKELLAY